MVEGDILVLPAEALAEAKTLMRAGDAGEDALIGAILQSAGTLCEQFTCQVLIARTVRQTLDEGQGHPRERGWRRLARTPVRAIGALEALTADGSATVLAPADHAVDIDANGDGWVRSARATGRLRVTYEAGLAADWAGVPAPLRHGILRLTAHLFTFRADAGAQAEPPAAVTALWRPWRRLRLG
jgi:uncharacterized phiE125 gp8 family phage protein